MKIKFLQSNGVIFVLSFCATFSLRVDMAIQPFWTSFLYPDMLSFFLFVVIFILGLKTKLLKNKQIIKYALAFACLLALFTLLGYSLTENSSLYSIYASRGQVVKYVISFLGMFFCFYLCLVHLLHYILNYVPSVNYKVSFWTKKKSMFVVGAIIFLCYLPYFLIYYPGIVTWDSVSQIYQSIDLEPFSNHHPFAHTMFVLLFVKLGIALHSVQLGIALHSLGQMLIVSAVFSFAVYKINQWKLSAIFHWLSLIYFALYPLHIIYSFTVSKDVLFSSGMLLFTIVIIDLVNNRDEYFSRKANWLLFIVISLMVILLRNNGIYVVFPSLFIFILFLKKQRKQLVIIAIGLLAFFIFYKTVIFSIFNVMEGPSREMLSVPLQQLARVAKIHEADLTDEQTEFMENVFLVNVAEIGQAYLPRVSDPVKVQLNETFYKNNKILFYTQWLKMFGSYPLTYIESFLANSFSYWSFGTSYSNFYYLMDEEAASRVDVYSDSKLPVLKSIASNFLSFRFVPVLSIFFSIGFAFFLLLLYSFVCIVKKAYINILVVVPLFLLTLTCIASPVNGEFRYILGLFTTLPILIAHGMNIGDNNIKCESDVYYERTVISK